MQKHLLPISLLNRGFLLPNKKISPPKKFPQCFLRWVRKSRLRVLRGNRCPHDRSDASTVIPMLESISPELDRVLKARIPPALNPQAPKPGLCTCSPLPTTHPSPPPVPPTVRTPASNTCLCIIYSLLGRQVLAGPNLGDDADFHPARLFLG